jgi:hypothetical protein
MSKPKNFPGRRHERRQRALDRGWTFAKAVPEDRKGLIESVTTNTRAKLDPNARSNRTKKTRGVARDGR